jgi:tetraacyldisaccharide 4'-kinase
MRRPLLLPLVPLYAAALAAKNALYAHRFLPIHVLAAPVVSVGSLSAGGAGKTPVVLALAQLLARHGILADVLSRGYGRGSGVSERVNQNGSASRFGDEPLELAQAGLSVFVGAQRVAAGRLAEAGTFDDAGRDGVGREPASLHLLDDGFQHRQLHRSLDLVLLTAHDICDQLLPAGNLREPLGSLSRAGAVLLREEEAGELIPAIRRYTQAPVWTLRRDLVLPAAPPARPVVFCGLARPEGFLAMLRDAGVEPAETVLFPDHHACTPDDLARLVEAARHASADGFLTTAKDFVKLTSAMLETLQQAAPVHIARLRVTLQDQTEVVRTIRQLVRHMPIQHEKMTD